MNSKTCLPAIGQGPEDAGVAAGGVNARRPAGGRGSAGDGRSRVTVVVLTCNRRDELCRSLTQLSALPEQPPIITVDNGSSDDTAEFVRTRFPRVQLVRSERNLGAAGRNLGAERARTPYIAFSDDDTWWEPGALDLAAAMLDRHPDIAILNARIVVGPEARPDPACEAMERSPLERMEGVGPMLTGFMAGAAVMRTSAFLQAGGYWRNFFIGGEEALLAMDVLDAGGLIVYAPALLVHHWPSRARDSALRRRLIARNAIWTAWLRLPWRVAWRLTRETLRQLPGPGARCRVLGDITPGVAAVLARRRVLREQTCRLLESARRREPG